MISRLIFYYIRLNFSLQQIEYNLTRLFSTEPMQVRMILEKFPKQLDLSDCDKVLKLLPKNPQSKDNYCEQISKKISAYQKQYNSLLEKHQVTHHCDIPFGSNGQDFNNGARLHKEIYLLKERGTYAVGYNYYDPSYKDMVELLSHQNLQSEFGIRPGVF